MRRRLLVVTLAVIAAALLAFAVPLGVAVRGQLLDRALDELAREASQVATFVEDQARTCPEARLWLAVASRSGLDVALFDRTGRLLFAAGARPSVGPDVAEAARGEIGRHHDGERLAVSVPLASQVCGVPLVLSASRPATELDASVTRSWLAIAGVGAGVLAAAAVATRAVGARLARPLEDLAVSARRLGDGDFSTRAPRSGLPEPDQIAEALDATADRLGRAVARGSAFTADASHQLRTPLTALRVHLEGLQAAGADRVTVDAALDEADRLERTIAELVSLTRLDAPADDLELARLVTERGEAWADRAAAAGRDLAVEVERTARVRARRAAVSQAVDVLVDNAIAHGRGRVTVRLATGSAAGATVARICVEDEGPGPDADSLPAPSTRDRGASVDLPLRGGRGLPLARSLVEGEGGRLVLGATAEGWRACLVLPVSAGSPPVHASPSGGDAG